MSEKNGHVLSQKDISDCEHYIKEITACIDNANLFRDKARGMFTDIVKRKLYLLYCDSAEEFANKFWNKSRSWLYQQLEIENVQASLPEDLSTHVDTLPKARELAKVPKKRRMRLIEGILEQEKNITPAAIKEAAKSQSKPAPPMPPEPIDVKEVVYDATGYEVPEHLVEFYQQGKEFGKEMLTRVSSLRGALRRGEGQKDPKFAFISISTTMRQLDSVYAELTMLSPYVVCPNCQGQVRSHCVLCRTTGFIPEHVWKTAVDSQTKAVRQKGIDQKKKK